MKLRGRGGSIPILDHMLALLADQDARYRELREADNLRLQQRFEASEAALKAALLAADTATRTAMTAAEKAVTKAETATEKRFESVNEFRKSLADQTANFLPRAEYGSAHQALIDKITDLATRMDKNEGAKTGVSDGTKMLLAVGGFLLTAVSLSIGLYLALH